MSFKLHKNNAKTTLLAAISDVAGTMTIPVPDESKFPATGQFRATLWYSFNDPSTGEIVVVTNVSGNSWTITRGTQGTSAQAWSPVTGVVNVQMLITADDLDDIEDAIVSSGGTVTSVAVTGAHGISVSGSPITTSGTIALDITDIDVAHGGTGVTSLTAYAPLFGGTTSTGTVQSGTAGTSGYVLTSNGAGVLPTFQPAGGSSSGISGATNHGAMYATGATTGSSTAALTNGQLLIGSTGNAPVAATLTAGTNIAVTNGTGTVTVGITGAVGVTHGGTGLTSLASGKMLYASALNTVSALTPGTTMQIATGTLDTILGALDYVDITTDFTTGSLTAVQVTGLTSTVTVPGGRMVKITAFAESIRSENAGDGWRLSIWDGVVNSGTKLASCEGTSANADDRSNATCMAVVTPAAGSKTYNVGLQAIDGGIAALSAAADAPSFLLIEVI